MLKAQIPSDKIAISLSLACVLHCFLAPTLLIFSYGVSSFSIESELIHYLIGASFDLRGDRFVAAISANIKIDTMNSKCRWEDYLDATYKTKFLPKSIKEMVQNYQLKVKPMSEYIFNLLNHYTQLLMNQTYVSIEEIYVKGGRMDLYIPNHSFPRIGMI